VWQFIWAYSFTKAEICSRSSKICILVYWYNTYKGHNEKEGNGMSVRRVTEILAVLMLFMTACGNEGTGGSGSEETVEGTVTISAAASLTDAMDEIAEKFMEEYPEVQVDYNFGGSGALSQQIVQGAPADLFLSASEEHFQAAVDEGFIDEENSTDLLRNELVLITPQGNDAVTSFEGLSEAEQIAMGTPESVPAGAYGAEALESMRLMENLEGAFVYAEDVRAVLTYVETGNVDAGLVYRTDAETSDKVEIIETAPDDTHAPIVYPAGMIKDSQNPEAAEKFYDYLQSEEALEVFKDYGFVIE